MTESNLQQQILTFLNANQEGSFTAAEIGTALKQPEAEFTLSVQALAGLERAGKVAVTDTGKWQLGYQELSMVTTRGLVSSHMMMNNQMLTSIQIIPSMQ